MSDSNKHENSEKSKTDLINNIVQSAQSKDVIIAVTGRVGSGTSWILGQIEAQLKNINTDIKTFIIKASDCIKELSSLKNIVEDLDKITNLQNEGDNLRKEHGNNILAIAMMRKMKLRREELLKEKNDNKGIIYLFDSLKHPDEVKLLRSVYEYEVDGALIVFEQEDKWRLSFVSEIRSLNDDGNTAKKITEPKRYTYLLGRGEKTKTPVTRLVSIAGKPFTLEDIRSAFSVEALNEEFYSLVARYFYELVGVTETKRAKEITHNRALKLPGLHYTSETNIKTLLVDPT